MDIKNMRAICENCMAKTAGGNLYVDIENHEYIFICPKCFDKKYKSNIGKYFERAKHIDSRIYTAKEYSKHKNDTIHIGYGEALMFDVFLPVVGIEQFKKEAFGRFMCEKVVRKFIVKNLYEKESTTMDSFRIAYKAEVKFSSYLEYLEHSVYMQFRKEIKDTRVL
jgi:hypothetical protein